MKTSPASKLLRLLLSTACAFALTVPALYAADNPKPAAPAFDPNGINWAKSAKEATSQAEAGSKLIFADFYTTWCPYCKEFDGEALQDARVIVLQGEFASIMLDAERGEGVDLAQIYGVKSYPTLLFFDATGQKVQIVNGSMSAPDFATLLAELIQSYSAEKLVKQANTSAKDPWAATSLAVYYLVLDEPDKAKDYLQRANDMSLTTTAGKKNQRRLMLANLAMGDAQEKDGFYEWARPYYEQAAKLAIEPQDVVSAKLEVANCFIFEKNKTSAVATLKEILAVPEINPAQKELANQLLEKANKLR